MGFVSTKLGRLTAIFIVYLLRTLARIAGSRTLTRRTTVHRSNRLGRIEAFVLTRVAWRVDSSRTDLGTRKLRKPLSRSRPPKALVKSAPIPFGTHSGSIVVAAFRAVLVLGTHFSDMDTRGCPTGRSRSWDAFPVEAFHAPNSQLASFLGRRSSRRSAMPQRQAVLTVGTHIRARSHSVRRRVIYSWDAAAAWDAKRNIAFPEHWLPFHRRRHYVYG
jgi:hypothetical protein